MTSAYSAHIYNVKALHFRFSDALLLFSRFLVKMTR